MTRAVSGWETVVSADGESDGESLHSGSHFPASNSHHRHPTLELPLDHRLESTVLKIHTDSIHGLDEPSSAPAVTRRTTITMPPNFSRPRLFDTEAPQRLVFRESLPESSSLYSEAPYFDDEVAPASQYVKDFPRNSGARMLTPTTGGAYTHGSRDAQLFSKSSSSLSDDPFKYDSVEYADVLQSPPQSEERPHPHRYRFDVPRDFRLMSQHHPLPSGNEQHVPEPSKETSFYHSAAIRSA
ncbi:hypothetical protein CC79DRAFT_1365880 [Sarocladium strictum]